MTVHAIAGLALFNLVLAAMGTTLMFGLRPELAARDAVRLAGVSYLLGVAAAMVAFTLVIVAGIPLAWPSILACIALLSAAGLAAGRRRRRRGEPARRLTLTLPSAAILALVVVILEAVFRKGRLQGLLEFDSWNSWGPKAKALYFFGHLRPDFLADLPGGSYPPGLPALLAGALHFIGSPDMVTLHLQYWFLGAGFVAALVGLLAGRVDPLILFPFALLVFVLPDIRSRSVDLYGDLPLGFAVATMALLLALWLTDGADWQLVAAAVLGAGVVLTKREGLVFVVCAVLAAFAGSLGRARRVWARLAGVLAAGAASWLVWQVWLSTNDLPGNGPSGGLRFLSDLDRGRDSLRTVVENLFEFDLWLVSITIGIAAAALCLVVRAWREAAYLVSVMTLFVAASSVVLWSDPALELTDVNVVSRLDGTTALSVVALTPLALQRAWGALPRVWHVPRWHRALAWAAVAAAAVAYPATLLVNGGARFPSSSDCEQPGFLSADSYPEALRLGTNVTQDGCGRLRVQPLP